MTICKGIKYLDEYLDEHLLPWTVKHRNTEQVNSGVLRFKSSWCMYNIKYYNEQFNGLSKFNNYTIKSLHMWTEMKSYHLIGVFPNIL